MLLQDVCAPGLQELVQELPGATADGVGLAGHVAGHDGDQAARLHVLQGTTRKHDAQDILDVTFAG